ncbi:hypothetical protein [Sphingobacterium sp.]|uniref:hypothetical protein n=1 Tax=Sphingobacterium sp. TaxID=341027 RepID=UPI0028AD598E|nr:hypothetical protein [Sphingobacterium sp.]
MKRMPCCREYLPKDHPFWWDDPLKAFQGQSHRTGRRHSIHFSATGNEPGLKGFLWKEDLCISALKTHSMDEIFVG